jgi:hypothetical protein
MSGPPLKVDDELDASLRRIRGALQQNRSQYASVVEHIMAATSAEVVERISEKTERISARIAERHQRRLDRWERRRERRKERESHGDAGDLPRGIVFAMAAMLCVIVTINNPGLFWMVWVALGFGMSAASSFGRAMRHRRLEREAAAGRQQEEAVPAAPPVEASVPAAPATTSVPAPPLRTSAPAAPAQAAAAPLPPEPVDPKVARIQALCDKLLAELESGPPIVREVVTEPQATIGGLRQACLETARRERELRSVLSAQDEAVIRGERDALAARLANERDDIVRDRLGQALGALDQQLAHRAELTTAATRLEAENTRILYTLENLHMQLLRARSTDIGAPELGGRLRQSLRELGTQIDAVAEALEFASAPAAPDPVPAAVPDAPPVPVAASPAPTASDEAQRAERAEAARRAAQARDAQRH